MEWEQCKEEATVMLKVKQDKEKATEQPICKTCWEECRETPGIKILDVRPLTKKEKARASVEAGDTD